MRLILIVFFGLLFLLGSAQTSSITYKTNGLDSLFAKNPFQKFIGEWTLKNNSWTHNWGGETETIVLPKHHTVSTQINTANSLFSIIDGPLPNGHIFWSYNPVTGEINHLSSFGELRAGVGEGDISKEGNVTLKITFEGEPKDTYRIYKYQWVTPDAYHMKSVQYNSDNRPTGLFYEGTFVRLPNKLTTIRTQIETILSVLDDNTISVEEQLEVYAQDVVHMAPDSEANLGKKALGKYLKTQRQYGEAKMKHKIIEMESFADIILMRGEVTGTFYSKSEAPPIDFITKNLFVFNSKDGALKIKKVIYNTSPIN